MSVVVPVLETERLVLRGHAVSDFADCCRLWGDPAVTQYIGGRPSSPEEVWARILRYAGHWTLLGFGYWVIAERVTGQFVGEAGLADFHRAIEPSINGTPEAGWALLPAFHGRGLAREALEAILAWGLTQGHRRTVCMIDPANAPSLRLAEALGYTLLARTRYKDAPTILFAREQ